VKHQLFFRRRSSLQKKAIIQQLEFSKVLQLTDRLTFSPNTVYLWWTSIDELDRMSEDPINVLTPDEIGRANRFAFIQDRKQFVLARVMLRYVLAQHLDQRPEEITFCYGAHGKPYLKLMNSEVGLSFNLAHSHEIVLCAVAQCSDVGVDVEYVHSIDDLDKIASVAFSSRERAQLLRLSGNRKLVGFFNCWTRKEAYVKACGNGLSMELAAFDVSLVPEVPAALLAHQLDPQEVFRWSLYDVSPADGYVGALAVRGQDYQPVLQRWYAAR
jgi:4'-phosphopantetheinyl transferase